MSGNIRVLVCLFCLIGLTGCSRLETEYGRSVGVGGRKSIAGFGVLRDFYRRNDWNDRTLSRLSERSNNVDTIVLIPLVEGQLSREATDWFETWLARGDKTLIYVLKDHRTEYEYWRRASRLAPPAQRLEYRRRLARAKLARDRSLLSRPPVITNGWFTASPLKPVEIVTDVGGPWSETLTGFQYPVELEYEVRAFDKSKDTVAAAAAPNPFGLPSDYRPSDLQVNFEVLFKSDNDVPIVSQITHENWPNSEIIVVSAGSLLTNFGLTDSGSQQLAAKLLAESGRGNDGEEPKVGFLAGGPMGVNVSSLNPKDAGPTGMEMFKEYPLNVVTIHLVILMSLVCLMLFPIFGRPQRIPPRPTADFAAHIIAVAGLMRRTGGTQYAKVRISEYMVRIRGESDGPWVIKDKDPILSSTVPAKIPTALPATESIANAPTLTPSSAVASNIPEADLRQKSEGNTTDPLNEQP